MATRYLILRANRDLTEPTDLIAMRLWRRADGSATELTVEIADGHETDLGLLREDPKNAAVLDADVMLSLVAPIEQRVADPLDLRSSGNLKLPDGLLAVGADTTPFAGQGVTVAILDTGIDETHPVFAGKAIVKRDFTGEGRAPDDVADKSGHGTHCAGTICGNVVDGVRVGVAPGVTKLCVGKVLGTRGGTMEMILKAMIWAVFEEKAAVVSMSLGFDLPGNTERLIAKGVPPALAANAVIRQHSDSSRAVSTLRSFLESQSSNVVFAAASGNESKRPSFVLDASLPAAELFPVGAVGFEAGKWNLAEFSNGCAQVVAPGVGVISAAVGGGWTAMSGTSMATPHVAGVAALWTEKLRAEGGLVPGAVIAALKAHAIRTQFADIDFNAVGAGMVRAPQ